MLLWIYIALALTGVAYICFQLFAFDADGDDIPDDIEGFHISLAAICYFFLGFGAGGLCGISLGAGTSLALAALGGLGAVWILKKLTRGMASFCKKSENRNFLPEQGDLCISLNNVKKGDVGTVRVFRETPEGMKELPYLAIADEPVSLNERCRVMRVDGLYVGIVPEQKR